MIAGLPQSIFVLAVCVCTGCVNGQVLPMPFRHCSTNTTSMSGKITSSTHSCPPWTYHQGSNSTTCECGNTMSRLIVCEKATVELQTCHCMSYNKELDMVLMGSCPYLCTNQYYIDIPCTVEELDNLCLDFNRTGQFCGECKHGHAPAAYTYLPDCVECSSNGWLKYLVAAYVPLTVFYIVVVFLRLNAMSPSLNAYILFCQILSCRAVTSAVITYVYYSQKYPVYPTVFLNAIIGGVFTTYSVWNLDFFRYTYEPFCLHEGATMLDMIALDYAVAVYPLLLILITYALVKVHDRMKVVQIMWKPMAWVFVKLNKKKGVSTSLIEAFGTFFLLSYVKIVSTSADLLMSVRGYNVTGNVVGKFLYHDGSVEYFGSTHKPYAIIAIFMFVTFNVLPLLLLCLYPCRCTQSCLNCCRLNGHTLRTFMDAFQGCYKFEPYDLRSFSGFYLFLRIAFLWNFNINKSPNFVIISGLAMIPIIMLILISKPYRNNFYNMLDVIFFLVLLMFAFSATTIPLTSFDLNYLPYSVVTCVIAIAFPPLYALVLTVYTLLPKFVVIFLRRCIQKCMNRVITKKSETSERSHLLASATSDAESPY